MGRFVEALEYDERYIETVRRLFGRNSEELCRAGQDLASNIDRLAKKYYREGRYGDAKPLYERAHVVRDSFRYCHQG